MSTLDRMTRTGNELTRLGTTVDPNYVMSTSVRHWLMSIHLLEGQEPYRDEILKRVKARYTLLKSQTRRSVSVAKDT